MGRRAREAESLEWDGSVVRPAPVATEAVKVSVVTRGVLACLVGLLVGAGWFSERGLNPRKPDDGVSARSIEPSLAYTLTSAFTSDGRTFATGGSDSILRTWDSRWGRWWLKGTYRGVRFSAFSPDGGTLALNDAGTTVRLLDTSSGATRRVLATSRLIKALAFSPDGRILAAGHTNGTVTFWDPATGRINACLPRERGADGSSARPPLLGCLAFAPDGKTLAIGRVDGDVTLWDLGTNRHRLTFHAHDKPVTCLQYAPDGLSMATAATLDSIARLWDSRSGSPLAVYHGHAKSVSTLRFAPDGRTLATAGGDGVVLIWSARSGRVRARLRGHAGWLWTVSFSPDGARLASGGADGTVRFWELAGGGELTSQTLTPFKPVDEFR